MEPVTVVVSAGHIYFVLGVLVGIVGGWFAGTYYQRRRTEGMTKDEIKDDVEARLKMHLNTVGKVLQAEIQKIKPKE